jgi:DnaJ-class molecular chaperone
MPMLGKSKKKKENGHLYIQFEVEFPKKIPDEIVEKLSEILPKKTELEKKEGEDLEEVSLVEPNFENYDAGETNRNEAYLSDEEQEKESGGGGGKI